MKYLLSFIFIFVIGTLSACHDNHFGLALNQRSFYNPAALCPYCKGSPFMSSGFSFMPGVKNNSGFYYAFGNDEDNFVHGPWDMSYSQMKSDHVKTNAFGIRYAYAKQMGDWKAAIGMRASFYHMQGIDAASFSTKLFDGDAGMMLTNQKGFYVGFSVLHLGSPAKTINTENGITYAVSLPQTFSVMSGYVQKINEFWDVLHDLSFMANTTETVFQPGGMIRFKHHYALGGGMTFASNEKATYDLRGGYMSSRFKFLASACPTNEGWTIETGITYRFWIQSDCDGGICSVKHPWSRLDDFRKHR